MAPNIIWQVVASTATKSQKKAFIAQAETGILVTRQTTRSICKSSIPTQICIKLSLR